VGLILETKVSLLQCKERFGADQAARPIGHWRVTMQFVVERIIGLGLQLSTTIWFDAARGWKRPAKP
jgi:hypothetical protein